MIANPCSLSKHVATVEQAGWGNRERVDLGCVPRFQAAPPPMAPSDLRGMQLPAGWHTMVSFSLTSGNTEYLPNLPFTLRSLYIEKNRLLELPRLPDGLRILKIDNNELSELPELPDSLETLDVRRNRLVGLPSPVPNSLTTLHVTRNFITELPSLERTRLISLGLGYNRLTSLPSLPNTLRRLGCPNNELTSITNLPSQLELLNCANNPSLTTLKIDHLRHLNMLIANNCGLKRIPILPINHLVDDDDDNDNDNDNDNDANNDRVVPTLILHGNPFEPNFARIWQQYQENENYRVLRRRVLREHRRILAEQKATLGSMLEVFKPAVLEERLPEDPQARRLAEIRQRVFANYGPANLIASFITGKPGTLEAQRLALLGNQENLGAVPPGTEAEMRAHIANIAVGNAEDAEAKLMKERAKLYVNKSNLAEAKQRYEIWVRERLEQKLLSEKREKLIGPLTELQTLLGDEILRTEKDFNDFYFKDLGEKQKHLLKRTYQLEQECKEVIDSLYFGEECTPLFEKLINTTLKNKGLRKYAQLRFIVDLIRIFYNQITGIYADLLPATTDVNRALRRYKNLLQDPAAFVAEFMDLVKTIAETAFPDSRTDAEIVAIQDKLKELCAELVSKLKAFREKIIVSDAKANPNDLGVEPASKEEEEVLKELARIHNDFAQVYNDDEDEGEALRYAMAEGNVNNNVNNNDGFGVENNNENGNENRRGGRRRTPRQRKGTRQTRKH